METPRLPILVIGSLLFIGCQQEKSTTINFQIDNNYKGLLVLTYEPQLVVRDKRGVYHITFNAQGQAKVDQQELQKWHKITASYLNGEPIKHFTTSSQSAAADINVFDLSYNSQNSFYYVGTLDEYEEFMKSNPNHEYIRN